MSLPVTRREGRKRDAPPHMTKTGCSLGWFLLTLLAVFAAVGRADSEPAFAPEEPVFFSYAWPIGPDKPRDFTDIDIGPDSLSYPPSIRKHYPPEVFDRRHARGKLLVRRCYDRPFGPDGRKIPLDRVTVDDLVLRWTTALDEPGVDGIAIDEFIKKDPGIVAVWIEALRTVRERRPDALMFCWIAGKGLQVPELHRAIRDHADYCMVEIYYRESAAPGFPDFEFTRFDDALAVLERNAPGIAAMTMMGMGVHEKLFNDRGDIDYTGFIEAQVRYLTTTPGLKDLPGLAFYAPLALTQERIGVLDGLIRRYYGME